MKKQLLNSEINKKEVKAEKQRAYRAKLKSHTVLLNMPEYKFIDPIARKHKMSIPSFLKCSAFCYLTKSFLVPNDKTVKDILETLITIKSLLNKVDEKSNGAVIDMAAIINRYDLLKEQIEEALTRPKEVMSFDNGGYLQHA